MAQIPETVVRRGAVAPLFNCAMIADNNAPIAFPRYVR